MTRLAAGTRVRLRHDVDRYPHFIAPAGALGTVVDIGDESILAVVLDDYLPGAQDWANEVHWSVDGDDEPGLIGSVEADLEVVS